MLSSTVFACDILYALIFFSIKQIRKTEKNCLFPLWLWSFYCPDSNTGNNWVAVERLHSNLGEFMLLVIAKIVIRPLYIHTNVLHVFCVYKWVVLQLRVNDCCIMNTLRSGWVQTKPYKILAILLQISNVELRAIVMNECSTLKTG